MMLQSCKYFLGPILRIKEKNFDEDKYQSSRNEVVVCNIKKKCISRIELRKEVHLNKRVCDREDYFVISV